MKPHLKNPSATASRRIDEWCNVCKILRAISNPEQVSVVSWRLSRTLVPEGLDGNIRWIISKAILVIKGVKNLLWNCPHMNVTRPYWWQVKTGSGNGFVGSDNKPLLETMLTVFYVCIWPQTAAMSWYWGFYYQQRFSEIRVWITTDIVFYGVHSPIHTPTPTRVWLDHWWH